MPEIIPSSDAEFTLWLQNFVGYLVDSPAAPPLPESRKAALRESLLEWKRACEASQAAQAALAEALRTRTQSAAVVDCLLHPKPALPQTAPDFVSKPRRTPGIGGQRARQSPPRAVSSVPARG